MRDQQGFAEFAAARAAALRRQAYLLTGSPERAEQVASRALAETGRRWDRLGGADAAEEHARRVVASGALRGRGSAPAVALTAVGTAAATDDSGEAVWRALAGLPPRRRAVLVLRYDEGLDDAAVGARLGLPATTAAAEGEAGLASLRSLLRRRGRPEDLLPTAFATTPTPAAHPGTRPAPPAAGPAAVGSGRTPSAPAGSHPTAATGASPAAGTAGADPAVRGSTGATGASRAASTTGAGSAGSHPAAATGAGPAVGAGADSAEGRSADAATDASTAAGTGAGSARSRATASTRGRPAASAGPAGTAAARNRAAGTGPPAGGAAAAGAAAGAADGGAAKRGAAGTGAAAGAAAGAPDRGAAEGGGAAGTGAGGAVGVGARRRRRGWWAVAAGVVVVAVGAAVVVPMVRDEPSASAGPVPAATATDPGQLQWPARGPLTGDAEFLSAALRTWQDGVLDRQRPTRAAVLWAGPLDGARTALLQGTDGTGQSWVAEVAESAGAPALRTTEPLGRAVPLLALGTGAELRLLTPPGAAPGSVLAADGGEMRALTVAADGLTEPLAAPATGVRIALTDAGTVAGSGTVLSGRLSPVTGTVELTPATLGLGTPEPIDPVWYDDGALIARRLGGPVGLVEVGPVRGAPVRVGTTSPRLTGRAYEVVRGGSRYLATVVRAGGRPLCTDTAPVGPASEAPARPVVLVSRCIPRGSAGGVLFAVGTGGVRSVRVTVAAATPAMPPRPGSPAEPAKPARVAAISGAAGTGLVGLAGVLDLPPAAAPVTVLDGGNHTVARPTLPPYHGPKA